jgi:hypothetical protein
VVRSKRSSIGRPMHATGSCSAPISRRSWASVSPTTVEILNERADEHGLRTHAAAPRVLDIIGTFRFNFYEFDQSYASCRCATAEDLLGVDGPR